MLDRKTKGMLGEAAAVKHFVKEGYEVFLPFADNGEIDFVVRKNGQLQTVSVKATSSYWTVKSTQQIRYRVNLRTTSRSAVGYSEKLFKGADLLAVYILPLDKLVVLDGSSLVGRSEVSVDG